MERPGVNIVVDANVVAALVLSLPYSDQVASKMLAWKQVDVTLLAPFLLEYEVSTALRRAVVAGLLEAEVAMQMLDHVLALNIQCLHPTFDLHRRAMWWAAQLGYNKTYDAHYLAAAEQMQAELWTADRRLVNAARQLDIDWVKWIGE
ncbi:MAG: type II toxin-antitoxin system VapC family toxin [Anaerolineae bacterium]|nr:type II toxin-antitoxin system VapC family toxin [Anaerolineae bacterium]